MMWPQKEALHVNICLKRQEHLFFGMFLGNALIYYLANKQWQMKIGILCFSGDAAN